MTLGFMFMAHKTWRVSQFGLSLERNLVTATTMPIGLFALAMIPLAFRKAQRYHEEKKREKASMHWIFKIVK